jgi:hypothetical protein
LDKLSPKNTGLSSKRNCVNPHHKLLADILIAINPRYGLFWKNETGSARTERGAFVRYGLPGSSDILGVCNGTFVAIEVKTGTGRLSPIQKNFKAAVEKNLGVFILARDVYGVCAELERLMKTGCP